MLRQKLTLRVLPEQLAICKFKSTGPIPDWIKDSQMFYSITKTPEELSIVALNQAVPEEVTANRKWRAFKIKGPLDLSLTGILSSLLNPLAHEKIPIFTVSTFDTDYILVQETHLAKAKKILESVCSIEN